MDIEFTSELLPGSCGISCLYGFADNDWSTHTNPLNGLGGAGWTSAGFIDSGICKQYYEEFKQRMQIVYQTPVRVNENSGNEFIFVVYDGTAEVIDNSNFTYPWK